VGLVNLFFSSPTPTPFLIYFFFPFLSFCRLFRRLSELRPRR
jgi:hypothetical protein